MNASKFMDKQVMKINNTNTNDFIDLLNPQSEGDSDGGGSSLKMKKEEILPNYDFQPIRPSAAVQLLSSDPPAFAANASGPSDAPRAWNSLDSKSNSSPLRSYNSLDHAERDKTILEKAQKVNDLAILSEIDRTMKMYIESVLHAIDGLSARLSQMDSRTRHLEYSVDELKDLKVKQDVMEGHLQLVKLQNSKVNQSSELSNAVHPDQYTAASAPPQQTGFEQLSVAASQQVPSLPSNVPPPSQQNIHSSTGTTQFLPGRTLPGPQQDAYLTPPNQTQEVPSQQFQMPPPAQHPQQAPTLSPAPQQYQLTPTPPYPQPSQPLQQHPVVGANTPQFSPPLGPRPEEGPYIPPQTYPSSLHQPISQPSNTPPHNQPFYGSPPMHEPPPTGTSSSGPSPAYVLPSGPPGDPYPYGGPASHYGSGSAIMMQPHSPVGSSSNYPQLPTARILPPVIPTAAGISGASSGGIGNRVPIDDIVDKVTNMGFPRDHVRATVHKLTENGQSVDLNIVLDKLMNDGEIQPPKGWFGR